MNAPLYHYYITTDNIAGESNGVTVIRAVYASVLTPCAREGKWSWKYRRQPTPPLTQHQSVDNKLGLMLGSGRGRWAVAQILILMRNYFNLLKSWNGEQLIESQLLNVSFKSSKTHVEIYM